MNIMKPSDLLAHSGEMMLLDKIVRFDDQSMVSEVTVRADGLFGDDKGVPALVGIEYMAQTISAHGGMMDKIAQRPTYLGFLLGTRSYTSNVDCFLIGSVLTVTVEKIMQEQGLGVFGLQHYRAWRVGRGEIECVSARFGAKPSAYRVDNSWSDVEKDE